MPPTYKHFLRRLLTAPDPRLERGDPCSGEGCGARRHVGWTLSRLWHPRRSPRNSRHGRGTPRGRSKSASRARARRSCTPPLPAPFEVLRLRRLPEALGTGHRRYVRSHLPKRRPEPTNSACHSPYGEDMGSRARCARSNGHSGPGRPPRHVTNYNSMER